MPKITPCLWFDRDGEEAANFYVTLVPDSRVDRVVRSPADFPSGKEGDALTVEFTLAGHGFVALNGHTPPQHTDAVSFQIECADQAELDRIWNAIEAHGGKPVACGWIQDRWGVRWQVFPAMLPRLLADPDRTKAKRAMEAMMGMVKIDVAELERAAEG